MFTNTLMLQRQYQVMKYRIDRDFDVNLRKSGIEMLKHSQTRILSGLPYQSQNLKPNNFQAEISMTSELPS